MRPAGTPPNEPERLHALSAYEILDTAPEPAFDGLTSIAAHILDVPMAMISLVDARRTWFKSRHGLEVGELPRELRINQHLGSQFLLRFRPE